MKKSLVRDSLEQIMLTQLIIVTWLKELLPKNESKDNLVELLRKQVTQLQKRP